MNRSTSREEDERHDQLPSVEEIKVSQGPSTSNEDRPCVSWLCSTTCVFASVLLVGFLLGFIGMTVFIETEDPLSQSAPGNGPNNNDTTDEPQTSLQSRLEAVLGVKATEEIFIGTSYQALAIQQMEQEEDIYLTYSNERLKQVYGLLCLYYATNDNGNAWSRAPSWGVDYNECQWEGIRCSSLDHVVEIDLAYFGLDGVVPSEITLVESVLVLRLDDNPGLTGTIPAFFGQMNLCKYPTQRLVCGKAHMTLVSWLMNYFFAVQLSVTGCGYVGEMPAEVCALKESNPNALLAVECALIQCDGFCCTCG